MAYLLSAVADGRLVYSHLSAFDGAAAMSVSFWFLPPSGVDVSYGRWLTQGDGTTGWLLVSNSTDPLSLVAVCRGGTNQVFTAAFSSAEWRHGFVCFDGTQSGTARGRLWVNGVEVSVASGGPPPPTLATTTAPLCVGKDPAGSSTRGSAVAEVAIWDRAITDATLIGNLAAGRLPTVQEWPSNLRFYAPLRDDAVAVVAPEGFTTTPTIENATVVAHPSSVDVYTGQMARLIRRPGFVNTPRLSVARRTV